MKLILSLVLCLPLAFAQTPDVAQNGVLNGASFDRNTPVAAGSLVSIFGTELAAGLSQADSIPLATRLGDVSVRFNNVDAPLVFTSPGQINAQLPWNIAPGNATVVVTRGNTSSPPRNFQVGPFSPGIFAVNFGSGQAIAINADGSLAAPEGSIPGVATRPARAGDTIVILATGLGPVDSPVPNGANSSDRLRNTTTTPVVLIGGQQARVIFSGLSPQFVGVNQLNVEIPPGVTGPTVSLQLQAGGITTTDRVTIAIQ
jgi:uncharacterized protein (TIGR03437 family)